MRRARPNRRRAFDERIMRSVAPALFVLPALDVWYSEVVDRCRRRRFHRLVFRDLDT